MKQPLFRILAMLLALFVGVIASTVARAQSEPPAPNAPDAALAAALIAACREDDANFATFLTADSAAAFQALPTSQRTALMKRFVLLDDPGKPLLSSSADGHQIVRCESPGFTTELRFGAIRLRENLAFIPVEIPLTGDAPRKITFGLVRENNNWKILSVGLVMLDIPALAGQWAQADEETSEQTAINDLRQLASALNTYRNAYGKLPDTLTALGPAAKGEISPETAGLIDADLAAGSKDGYAFRYTIVPAAGGADDPDKAAEFALAGAPDHYGKAGHRSFFLDSEGVLRGADKHGAVATSSDPRIDTP